jgi:hypothetical protein
MKYYLQHHGIKGQKWGVRRYQNEDGSLTPAGKKRYLREDGSLNNRGKSFSQHNINEINRSLRSYTEAANRFNASQKWQRLSGSENDILIYDKSAYEDTIKMAKFYQDAMARTMNSLRGTDYAVGYNFIQDNYYLRKVNPNDGVDHWALTKFERD